MTGKPPLSTACGTAVVVVSVLMCGCATTVVTRESPICEPLPDMMQPCSARAPIPEASTYADLLKIFQQDGENMAICTQRQRDLVAYIAKCNAAIARYNASVESDRPK